MQPNAGRALVETTGRCNVRDGRNNTTIGAPRRRGHARRSGQVLILAIVGMTMLVSLIFYVYNLGDQISRRMSLQNIADSVAVSGAGQMARCMNMVAMNNVAASRAIALVAVLDGIPLSSEMAYAELRAWRQGLDDVIAGMRGEAALAGDTKRKVLQGIEALQARLLSQEQMIEPILAIRQEIERATTWSLRGVGGSPPHGSLWRTAVTADEFSQATVGAAGVLAQANAVRFADDNFGDARSTSAAFIVPVIPQLPAHRGQLADFIPPLRQHLRVDLETASISVGNGHGGAIPYAKWPYRLGPWARLLHYPDRYYAANDRFDEWFRQQDPDYYQYHGKKKRGWRRPWGITVPVGPVQTRTVTRTITIAARAGSEGRRIVGPSAGGGRAGRAASRGYGPTAAREGRTYTTTSTHSWQPTRHIVRGYTTFGPYEWAKSWISSYAFDALADSRFREYYDTITAPKLNYIFGPLNPELATIHYPRWVMDINEARKETDAAGNVIRKIRTRYYYLEVIASSREGSSNWESSIISDNLSDPVTKDYGGWVSPEAIKGRAFGGSGALQVNGPVQVGALPMWRFTAEGKEQTINPDGTLKEERTVYFSWYFIFGGVDTGGEVEITNPANWDSYDEPPAPMVMNYTRDDTGTGPDPAYYDDDPEVGVRREHFAYFSIARTDTKSAVWGKKFKLSNPTNSIYTVAQAKIFNNSSWDLWTQDWQIQLTRVRDWDDWTLRLGEGRADVALTEGMVRENDLARAHRFMVAWPPAMADMSIHH